MKPEVARTEDRVVRFTELSGPSFYQASDDTDPIDVCVVWALKGRITGWGSISRGAYLVLRP
jgi:hypothetical protein